MSDTESKGLTFPRSAGAELRAMMLEEMQQSVPTDTPADRPELPAEKDGKKESEKARKTDDFLSFPQDSKTVRKIESKQER